MPRPADVRPLTGRTDPEDVFLALATDHADVFWLDAGPGAHEGWSWVGVGTRELDVERVRALRVADAAHADVPGPFRGGWIGWAAYEAGARAAGAPVHAADDDVPEQLWLRVDEFVAFEHATARAWAVSRTGDAAALAARVHAVPRADEPVLAEPATATARHAAAYYADMVELCRDRIRDGDAYQLCLTTRFTMPGAHDPVAAYRRLRRATPSHHGGIVRSGATALVSASPERFLEIRDGVVRTHPIKGTRRRDADPARDAALVDELVGDPKEQAENVMIVDLMRNDLSRVCAPGSVSVERLLEVESYPAVHQLVSTIAGRLRADATLGDVLDAAFPAGSMTGAPKLSAMTILHALENGPRGVFAGCFGWIGDDGSADLAMVIRSIVTHAHGAYVGAGGGITWRSRPLAEVAEVALKARAPLAAVGAEVPSGW